MLRPRPIVAVRLLGPGGSLLRDGLLDTGSDETVFPDWMAAVVGVDLAGAEARPVGLAGRPPVTCRYAAVRLRITDGVSETYDWPAVVGFLGVPIVRPLLGYAGFLQDFDAEFRGADQEVVLVANRSYLGLRI